jgi:formylglycine-generating enzyme required for sulfatase activity
MSPRTWFRLLVLSALLIVLGFAVPGLAQRGKGKKYAFLVACSGYTASEFRKLPGTVAEMRDFRQALLASGFHARDVVFMHDDASRRYLPEKKKLLQELALLLGGVEKEDTLVVALNGHGLHFKDDKVGYFVPLDGRVQKKETLLPMDGKGGLFEKLKECAASRKLLVVNACRNDPLDDAAFAVEKRKIDDEDKAEVPEGIAALYSCRPGQKSYEYPRDSTLGKPGRSLFFHHVIEAWQGKYAGGKPVTLEHLFNQVRVRTRRDASELFEKLQVPQARREYSDEWVVNNRVLARLEKEITNSIGMKLVRIPAGKFLMGSTRTQQDKAIADYEKAAGEKADNDVISHIRCEGPRHEVEITKPFYLGICEVTQKQYRQIMGNNPSWFSSEGGGKDEVEGLNTDDFPVEHVSWDDAQTFLRKLSALPEERKKGRDYRLPTEAEWEYACRGGRSDKTFHYGNSLSSKQANFNGRDYPYGGAARGPYLGRTRKVGSYRPNAFGLYDMHGNVWEWCQDCFDAKYYLDSPKKDPKGPSTRKYRVLRGGAWNNHPHWCRSAYRGVFVPGHRYSRLGFRVVCSPVAGTP